MGRQKHDWTLRPELMRRKAVPVGNWPTVADIPHGAIVLDSDGVVKACRWVFHNAGVDWIGIGRPSYLSKMRPSIDVFSVYAVINRSGSAAHTIVSFGAGAVLSERQFHLFIDAAGLLGVVIGGIQTTTTILISPSVFYSIKIVIGLSSATMFVNGVSAGVASVGAFSGTQNLFIGGRTDGASINFEGDTECAGFYDSTGATIDKFDPNRDDLWNGGSTGATVMGAPFTVSDGTPTGCRTKALVPLTLLCP